MDLRRDFYFSFTYDLTNTLQLNMGATSAAPAAPAAVTPMAADGEDDASPPRPAQTAEPTDAPPPSSAAASRATHPPTRNKFVWNHHLANGLLRQLDGASRSAWVPPVVHGFFQQSSASLFGRSLVITLIARRSRLYAGARLLKRGLTESGHCANEVEVEQIVCDGGRGALHEGGFTSSVQLRASVPILWSHGEQKHVVPRPDIHVQHIDPTYQCTYKHVAELYERYGGPIFALSLIRQWEKRPREVRHMRARTATRTRHVVTTALGSLWQMLLGDGYADACRVVQARMRREGHACSGELRYVPFDFKRESKRKGGDIVRVLERLAAHMAT